MYLFELWFSQGICPVVGLLGHCYSVAKLCLTLCDPIDCSMPVFLVLCYMLEFAQIHAHWVGDAIYHSLLLCLQSFLASGFLPMTLMYQVLCIRWPKYWSFSLASVLSTNIQGWFLLELTGLISLQSKELSSVFYSTTIWKHHFFSAQPSLWSNSHIHI